MSDPIDWPAMGMPEGVEVERTKDRTINTWTCALPDSYTLLELNAFDDGDLHGLYVDGALDPLDFPILEAFLRAARAIEAGEVELNVEDSDHA